MLIEAARSVPEVLDDPSQGVRSWVQREWAALSRAWTRSLIQRRGLLTGKVYFALYEALVREGIRSTNAQRDVHIVGGAGGRQQNSDPE